MGTGDLGRLDKAGVLWVLGRRDDASITGGENVQPEEIEAVLRACPGIDDAAVVGRPDPIWGQVLEAIIIGTASAEAVQAFCRERLPSFKVPRSIRFTTALPRSEGGKLLRRSL